MRQGTTRPLRTTSTTDPHHANPRGARPARLALLAAATAMVIAGVSVSSTAEARPRPTRHRSNFEANKTFGLGLMLGAPTGLSGKYFVGRSTALDFGLGTIYGYRDRRGLHLHADFLWHPVSLVSAHAFELPLYFGVGARLLDGDRCYQYRGGGVCDYYYRNYTAVGVRGPLGIAFDFNNVPIDIFFEVVPVFDILVNYDSRYDNALYFDIDAALGLRYYFN